MAEARSTDLIFTADYSELQSYYGNAVNSSIIELLQKCHVKMQSCKGVLHVTTNLAAIIGSKTLLMSAGGLGGCVYGIPIDDNGLVHNLGDYIIDDELPMFLANQSRAAEIESIEITSDLLRLGCVDYLDFGSTYYDYYLSSEYLNSRISTTELSQAYGQQNQVVNELHERLSSDESFDSKMVAIKESSSASYIVRMLYFEVALEYTFLHQNNQAVIEWSERNELYNKATKDLVFSLNPQLATRFSLKNFHSSPSDIDNYLQSNDIILNYEPGQFYQYLYKRLDYYIYRYLLNAPDNFKGHVLFRFFGERELFEADLAKRLWDEAKQKRVSILTYRLPKGEVGVLPGSAKVSSATVLDGACMPGRSLEITLASQLSTAHTAMRDPYTKRKEESA